MKTNYFELLGIKQTYKIDLNLVKQQYFLLQQKFHPDLASDIKLQKEYIEKSMLINEAFKIMNDDYKRAEYMLLINDIEFSDKALNSHLTPIELEEILNQHEMIDELVEIDELKNIYNVKLKDKAELMEKLNDYFEMSNFLSALDLTVRLKYLTNIINIIKSKIRYADN